MSYSTLLSLGEIAYDGFHAMDEEGTFTPFEQLPEAERERWAEGARNAAEAFGPRTMNPIGVDPETWRHVTRIAHAYLRNCIAEGRPLPNTAKDHEKEQKYWRQKQAAAGVRYDPIMTMLASVMTRTWTPEQVRAFDRVRDTVRKAAEIVQKASETSNEEIDGFGDLD